MAATVNQMTSQGESVHVRVISPELDFQTLIVFNAEDTVWDAKQRVINSLCKDLKDSLNYGLYCPSVNNRAGKFLDEERPLKDYPLPGPIGLLEFKYKKRVYKMQVNPTKMKKLQATSNLKKFMEYVYRNDAEKISELVNKGVDPNYYDDKGNTPLTAAATLPRPRSVMLALVSGSAYLDFRNRKGMTALHVAADAGNRDAIKTLLDLGASPNYKDADGLTALYYCVAKGDGPAQCLQMLLHDRAEICNRDDNGWTEIHHACMHGKVQHLEHLLFYGADVNAKSDSGDTALHLCARYNQEECARALMFRGADRKLKNNNGEDPITMSRLAGHSKLADVISHFRPEEVVLYAELPKYNEKRRGTISAATIRNLQRSRSNPQLQKLFSQDNGYAASLSSAGGYHIQMLSNSLPFQNKTKDPPSGRTQSHSESEPVPRSIVLHRGPNGFGFVLRGAKSRSGGSGEKLAFTPTTTCPALQYFDSIEDGSAAERAGLRSADFLLEVNGESVASASHEYTVSLIKNSGNQVVLKVVSPKSQQPPQDHTTSHSVEYARTTSTVSSTSLSPSIGSQFRSSLAGLEELERLDATLDKYENETAESVVNGRSSVTIDSPAYASVNREWWNGGRTAEPANGIHRTSVYVNYAEPDRQANDFRNRSSSLVMRQSSVPFVTQPEPEPDYDDKVDAGRCSSEDEESDLNSSSFTQMIKAATLNRERKRREKLDAVVQAEPQVKPSSPNRDAPHSPAFPAPPPPPPPPLSVSVETSSHYRQQVMTGDGAKRQVPPQVMRNLEENRRRDEAHAAIMAAVLKRRTVLEDSEDLEPADSIDSKLLKSKKLQVIYKAEPRSSPEMGGASTDRAVSRYEKPTNGSSSGSVPFAVGGANGSKNIRGFPQLVNGKSHSNETALNSGAGNKNELTNGKGERSEFNGGHWSRPVGGKGPWANEVQLQSSRYGSSPNVSMATTHPTHLTPHLADDDACSTVSSLSTLSTLSSLTPSGASSSSSSPPARSGFLPSKLSSIRDESRPTRSTGGLDLARLPEGVVGVHVQLLPPPVEFSENIESIDENKDYNAVPVSATLRSVTKAPTGNSMVFPARTKDNRSNEPGSENTAFARKSVESWSVSDVGDFLDSLDYGAYKSRFAKSRVDGPRLMTLEDPDLLSLGVEIVLHRIKLQREVRKILQMMTSSGNRK